MNRTKLLAARLRAAQDRPYFATALFSLTVVVDERVPTMGVDRHWRVYVSPSFVDDTPIEQLASVWIHEIGHLLRDHHGRAERLPIDVRRDHHRVNAAQDCEINDDLIADGLPLPPGRLEPSTFGQPPGKMFEEYLAAIPPTVYVECGSGAHAEPRPWELPGAGVSPVEADAIRRQTAHAIRQQARSRGSVPAGWRRWADEVLEPTIDWRQTLTGTVREAAAWSTGAVDYTYRRPSRRGAALPTVVLPSLRRPVPRVAIVIDTSGSMSAEDLAVVLAEVDGVLRAVGVGGNRVQVLACDADVHTSQAVATVGEIKLAGGGGTDMRVGIDRALRSGARPHIILVLTDGFTPWPEVPLHSTKLIAALIGTQPPTPPPWITSLRVLR